MRQGSRFRTWAQNKLRPAGIEIDGNRPWDIRVHNVSLYSRVALRGSLGLGEAYEEGWWDCDRLDVLFGKLLAARISPGWRSMVSGAGLVLESTLTNLQTIRRSRVVGERHYDIGNDLYGAMLDPHMIYSCAYYGRGAQNLEAAQEHKLSLICEKLQLSPGQRVLDIGCGWGGLAAFMAKHYGVRVVGVTISKEQAALARERCAALPVEIRLADYRELVGSGPFDRVVSVGMFEHVGPKNYRAYMEVVSEVLKDDGLFLLHTIGGNGRADPWIHKYIFPGGVLPKREQIRAATVLFREWDWHEFGPDYDRTLMAWHANFESSWDRLKGDAYDERFRRRWSYYLLSCAGAFRARHITLWQILLAKKAPREYMPIR